MEPDGSYHSQQSSVSESAVTDVSKKNPENGCKEVSSISMKSVGLHWFTTAIFIVGTMVGSGLVALPYSLSNTGVTFGLSVLVGVAAISGYTGTLLGNNWLLMQNRWPQYRRHCGDPYPQMAKRAAGRSMEIFVRVVLCFSQFGVVVVFMILASNNISSLLRMLSVDLHTCSILPALAFALLPAVMLESPKDFWQAAVLAALCTCSAIALLFVGISRDLSACAQGVSFAAQSQESVFLSFGTALFSFGGHACFPTFQHDMKKPEHFTRSVVLAFVVIFLMYAPLSLYAHYVYGLSVTDDVSKSVQTTWIRHVTTFLITFHVISAILIVISPMSHAVEKLFHVPQRFGWRRVMVRSAIWIGALFLATSVPKFGVFLDLVGGSTLALLALVFPSVFYLYLKASELKLGESIQLGMLRNDDRATFYDVWRFTPKLTLALNLICIIVGIVCGIAATIAAIKVIAVNEVTAPCYISMFGRKNYNVMASQGDVFCCGEKKMTKADFFKGSCIQK